LRVDFNHGTHSNPLFFLQFLEGFLQAEMSNSNIAPNSQEEGHLLADCSFSSLNSTDGNFLVVESDDESHISASQYDQPYDTREIEGEDVATENVDDVAAPEPPLERRRVET
jgi:hypothetical protein